MKPKFNRKNPIVQWELGLLQHQAEIAFKAPQSVEKAIIPIYAIPKTKAHQKPKRKAQQFGSGVLLRIESHYFILSCTHLFEAFEGFVLQTGVGKGAAIEQLQGDRFSAGKIDSPYSSRLDATVFHIQADMTDELKEVALTMDDLEFNNDETNMLPIYLAAGFRIKKSNIRGNQVFSKREAFASFEVNREIYEQYNIDNDAHFVMVYENDILVDGLWKKSPRPRGFSGGAIIKVEGTNILPNSNIPKENKQKLRAIITEQHRGKNNRLGVMVSTKVNVHIGLIYQFMPELFPNLIEH